MDQPDIPALSFVVQLTCSRPMFLDCSLLGNIAAQFWGDDCLVLAILLPAWHSNISLLPSWHAVACLANRSISISHFSLLMYVHHLTKASRHQTYPFRHHFHPISFHLPPFFINHLCTNPTILNRLYQATDPPTILSPTQLSCLYNKHVERSIFPDYPFRIGLRCCGGKLSQILACQSFCGKKTPLGPCVRKNLHKL